MTSPRRHGSRRLGCTARRRSRGRRRRASGHGIRSASTEGASAALGPGGASSAQGSVQRWLAPPLQSQRISWVPLVELLLGTSRQRPDCGFRRPPLYACHCWLVPPVQSQSSMGALLAVLPPVTSRHLPRARRVPSAATVHCWLAPPLQLQS